MNEKKQTDCEKYYECTGSDTIYKISVTVLWIVGIVAVLWLLCHSGILHRMNSGSVNEPLSLNY